MKRFMNKKVVIVAATIGLTLGIGGAAFAYFTSTGTGTGSVSTGTAKSNLTISDNSGSLSALLPGNAAQDLTVTVTNDNAIGGQSQYVTGLTAYLTVSGGSDATGYACSSADYLLNGTAGTSSTNQVAVTGWTSQELAGAASASTTGDGNTIQFNDLATVNQDDCQGATVTINYTSN